MPHRILDAAAADAHIDKGCIIERSDLPHGAAQVDFSHNGTDSGLPPLPPFMVNLYLSKDGGDHIVQELARIIRLSVRDQRKLAA